MSLQGKKVLVALAGGIACYKVPNLVRLLRAENAEVQVVMTDAAMKFITPLTLESVSNRPVATELFPAGEYVATRHVDFAQWPDLIVVAPATANFLGKVSAGISDDLLTTIICATAKPVMIAPAMNPQMWANKITQRNYAYVQSELGWKVVPPGEGKMACDDVGVGRMAEPEQIFDSIRSFFLAHEQSKPLVGKKVLVTAGPTREAIDPVRYLTNHSSGKMGYAIAEQAVAAGAETILISGPTKLSPPTGVRMIEVETTEQMHDAVLREFAACDYLIMAAAPADFTPETVSTTKIKKNGSNLSLSLRPAVDILKAVAERKNGRQRVIGFALETDNAISNAELKLKEKALDMIVLNSPGSDSGFDTDTNRVTLILSTGNKQELPLLPKQEIARRIVASIASAS